MIIDIYENTLSSQFCNHCIWKFERDNRKDQGLIGGGEVRTDIKDSMDLHLTDWPDWQKEDKIFYLQPAWNNANGFSLAIDFVKNNPDWKLSLQTHKYLKIN